MTRYELFERIGVGGMAEIFRGKAVAGRGFQKPVAIKRILPHLSQDERFVELLITEAKTLSELKHRNIVQIYDVGLGDDGQYFIVMEFVDGLDLADLFDLVMRRKKPLTVDVCLYIGAEVCEALEHAHKARDAEGNLVGLVHRDVSPSNILLSKSGEVKLTDFGIAKRMEELTGHGGVRGKFAYISPEQAHNKHVDGRSDVLSLGIVLFELLTNKPLFSHMPDFDALRAVRDHEIPNISTVDPSIDLSLGKLIMKALAAKPGDRYQSAKDFAAALRDYRYNMVSSSGDPLQAVARVVREMVQPRAPDPDELPDGEGTVVRILSSSGFPSSSDSIDTGEIGDPYSGAREVFDSYGEDDKTELARTPAPLILGPDGVPRAESLGDESTKIATPKGKSGKGRVSSVDPDADTEFALAMTGEPGDPPGDASDEDFEGDLETRVLDRNDPKMMAAIARGARGGPREARRAGARSAGPREPRRAVPLPSHKARSTSEDGRTLPRADPVRTPAPERVAPVRSNVSAPMAPRAPQYPTASLDESRRFNRQHVEQFLGMPRHIAYWVIGGAAAFLLIIIIVLLATRPSSGKAPEAPEKDDVAVPES